MCLTSFSMTKKILDQVPPFSSHDRSGAFPFFYWERQLPLVALLTPTATGPPSYFIFFHN